MKLTNGDVYSKGGIFDRIASCSVPDREAVKNNIKLRQWIKPLSEQVVAMKESIDKKFKVGEDIIEVKPGVLEVSEGCSDKGILNRYAEELNVFFKEEIEADDPGIKFTYDNFDKSDVRGDFLLILIDLGFLVV